VATTMIELSGLQGNAFWLMGMTRRWSKQLGIDPDPIIEDMKSGTYEHPLCRE